MTSITIYVKGGLYTPEKPDEPYSTMTRLYAAEGKLLSKGAETAGVKDVDNADASNWAEIDAPLEPTDYTPEEVADMVAALAALGVVV